MQQRFGMGIGAGTDRINHGSLVARSFFKRSVAVKSPLPRGRSLRDHRDRCKSTSKIDPHRRPTWTHPRERFQIFDEWFIGGHSGSAFHADGGSQAAPIHTRAGASRQASAPTLPERPPQIAPRDSVRIGGCWASRTRRARRTQPR